MPRWVLISSFLVFSIGAKCQNLVVSTNDVQVVYQNIQNPINTNLGCYGEAAMLITDNGVITTTDKGTYWQPIKLYQAFIKLIVIERNDTTILDSIEFLVKRMPIPTIDLNVRQWHAGIGSYESSALIFDIDRKYEYLNLKEKISIKSFSMYVAVEKIDGQILEYHLFSASQIFPNEFNAIRKSLRPGDTLQIAFCNILLDCDWINKLVYYDEYYLGAPETNLTWRWRIN